MEHQVEEMVDESTFIQERFFSRSSDGLVRLSQELANLFRAEGRLFLFGVGTSGHLAQILAGALAHRLSVNRPPLPAVALTQDGPLLAALAKRPRKRSSPGSLKPWVGSRTWLWPSPVTVSRRLRCGRWSRPGNPA
ncbi:MAG: SIS domain-containing protein [Acidobacteriota bacterium]